MNTSSYAGTLQVERNNTRVLRLDLILSGDNSGNFTVLRIGTSNVFTFRRTEYGEEYGTEYSGWRTVWR
jgi:hypothetical protein